MYKTPRDKTREALILKTWAEENDDIDSYNKFRVAMIVLAFVGLVLAVILMLSGCASASELLPVNRIADAIYKTEGGDHTKYAYGIKSIHATSLTEARSICIRTIWHKYRDYVSRTGITGLNKGFIYYLADRYCPYSADPIGNRNWKSNMCRILEV